MSEVEQTETQAPLAQTPHERAVAAKQRAQENDDARHPGDDDGTTWNG